VKLSKKMSDSLENVFLLSELPKIEIIYVNSKRSENCIIRSLLKENYILRELLSAEKGETFHAKLENQSLQATNMALILKFESLERIFHAKCTELEHYKWHGRPENLMSSIRDYSRRVKSLKAKISEQEIHLKAAWSMNASLQEKRR